jgi:hypothetical protein
MRRQQNRRRGRGWRSGEKANGSLQQSDGMDGGQSGLRALRQGTLQRIARLCPIRTTATACSKWSKTKSCFFKNEQVKE